MSLSLILDVALIGSRQVLDWTTIPPGRSWLVVEAAASVWTPVSDAAGGGPWTPATPATTTWTPA